MQVCCPVQWSNACRVTAVDEQLVTQEKFLNECLASAAPSVSSRILLAPSPPIPKSPLLTDMPTISRFEFCAVCWALCVLCLVLGVWGLVFGVWCLVFSVLCWGSIKHGLRPWSSALPIWTIQSVLTLSLCHVSLAVSGLEFSDYCFVFYDLFLCFVFSV